MQQLEKSCCLNWLRWKNPQPRQDGEYKYTPMVDPTHITFPYQTFATVKGSNIWLQTFCSIKIMDTIYHWAVRITLDNKFKSKWHSACYTGSNE